MARTSSKPTARINLKPYARHAHGCCSAGNQKMRVLGLGGAQFVDKDWKKNFTSGNESSGSDRGIPESSIDIEIPDDFDEESDSADTAADSTFSPNQVERLLAPSLFDRCASSRGYCGSISAGPSPLDGHPSLYYSSVPASGGHGLGPFATASQALPGVHSFVVGEPTITTPGSIPMSAPVPSHPLFGNFLDFQMTNYLDTSPTPQPLALESTPVYGFNALPTTLGLMNQGPPVGQNNNMFSFNGVDTIVPGVPLWNANVPQAFDYVPQPTTAHPTPSPLAPAPVPVAPEQPNNNNNNNPNNQGRDPPQPQATAPPPAADSDKASLLNSVQETLNNVGSPQPGADSKLLQEKLVKVRYVDMWFSNDSQT